jgi:hypothetical protein
MRTHGLNFQVNRSSLSRVIDIRMKNRTYALADIFNTKITSPLIQSDF